MDTDSLFLRIAFCICGCGCLYLHIIWSVWCSAILVLALLHSAILQFCSVSSLPSNSNNTSSDIAVPHGFSVIPSFPLQRYPEPARFIFHAASVRRTLPRVNNPTQHLGIALVASALASWAINRPLRRRMAQTHGEQAPTYHQGNTTSS